MGGIPLTQIIGSSDAPGGSGGRPTVFTNDMKAMLVGAQQTEAKGRAGGYPGLNKDGRLEEAVIPESIQRASKNGFAELEDDGTLPHEVIPPQEIPFPDVWIPLSDSLRMLAGYGREAKVGDDVVANYATLTRNTAATMVNKSLSLSPVAINEARFERDGVLTESMSTNLMGNHGLCLLRSGQLPVSPDSDGFFQMPTGDSLQFRDGVTLPWPPSEQCVLSVLVKGYGKFSLETSTYAAFVKGVSIVVDLDLVKVSDQSKGFILDVGGDVFLVGVYVTTASSPSTSITKGLYVNQVDGNNNIKAGYCQLESGYDATSRILTVGSSVTRAADKFTIPRLNNDCAEWYSGPDQINPIVTADTIELYPPAGKAHLRNVRGFFTPLTPAQKAALR